MSVYREVLRELPNPALIVHLVCAPETELERIRRRGRSIEKTITVEFLNSLNLAIEKRISEVCENINVLTIDSKQLDFANDERIQQQIIEMMQDSLPELSQEA